MDGYQAELSLTNKQGREFYLKGYYGLIKSIEGNIAGFICAYRDIGKE